MLAKLKKKFLEFVYEQFTMVQPDSVVPYYTLKDNSDFWVLNCSHVLGRGRAQIVLPLAPSTEYLIRSPVEEVFPYPKIQGWAHRMHVQNQMRQQLLDRANDFSTRVLIPNTWLPYNLAHHHRKEQLVNSPDLWRFVELGLIRGISEELATQMFDDSQAEAEILRLARLESVRTPESPDYGHQVLTEVQQEKLIDPLFVRVPYPSFDDPSCLTVDDGYSVHDLQKDLELHTIEMINKYCK